jgi:hypothetical protein
VRDVADITIIIIRSALFWDIIQPWW